VVLVWDRLEGNSWDRIEYLRPWHEFPCVLFHLGFVCTSSGCFHSLLTPRVGVIFKDLGNAAMTGKVKNVMRR